METTELKTQAVKLLAEVEDAHGYLDILAQEYNERKQEIMAPVQGRIDELMASVQDDLNALDEEIGKDIGERRKTVSALEARLKKTVASLGERIDGETMFVSPVKGSQKFNTKAVFAAVAKYGNQCPDFAAAVMSALKENAPSARIYPKKV